MKTVRGFSLIEILVVIALFGIMVAAIPRMTHIFDQQKSSAYNRTSAETSVSELVEDMEKTGRIASLCAKTDANTLECRIDFGVPPVGNLTAIRYQYDGKSTVTYFRYEGSNWTSVRTYTGVYQFVLCDDGDMKVTELEFPRSSLLASLLFDDAYAAGPLQLQGPPPSSTSTSTTTTTSTSTTTTSSSSTSTSTSTGTSASALPPPPVPTTTHTPCSLQPLKISRQIASNLSATYPTAAYHYFRFGVSAGNATNGQQSITQGSFFMRNPAPGGLTYQWGSRK